MCVSIGYYHRAKIIKTNKPFALIFFYVILINMLLYLALIPLIGYVLNLRIKNVKIALIQKKNLKSEIFLLVLTLILTIFLIYFIIQNINNEA